MNVDLFPGDVRSVFPSTSISGARTAPAPPLIGFLGMDETESRRRQTSEAFANRFREGLKAAGYVEGQNVKIDWPWAAACAR